MIKVKVSIPFIKVVTNKKSWFYSFIILYALMLLVPLKYLYAFVVLISCKEHKKIALVNPWKCTCFPGIYYACKLPDVLSISTTCIKFKHLT